MTDRERQQYKLALSTPAHILVEVGKYQAANCMMSEAQCEEIAARWHEAWHEAALIARKRREQSHRELEKRHPTTVTSLTEVAS